MNDNLTCMCIGQLIRLKKAAVLLAKEDERDCDIKWALSVCLSGFVRVGVKIPYLVNTWEDDTPEEARRKRLSPYIQKNEELKADLAIALKAQKGLHKDDIVGRETLQDQINKTRSVLKQAKKDLRIAKQREKNIEAGLNEPPNMGPGDYIGQRFGVFLLPRDVLEHFTSPRVDEVCCSRFYVPEPEMKSGYKEVHIASERDIVLEELEGIYSGLPTGLQDRFEKEKKHYEQNASNVDWLNISLGELFVWKDDFISLLQGESDETSLQQRQKLPMYSGKNDGRKQLSTPQQMKTINKLKILVYGMANRKYNFQYGKKVRGGATAETGKNSIRESLRSIGLDIDRQTLKNYLDDGYFLAKQQLEKQ